MSENYDSNVILRIKQIFSENNEFPKNVFRVLAHFDQREWDALQEILDAYEKLSKDPFLNIIPDDPKVLEQLYPSFDEYGNLSPYYNPLIIKSEIGTADFISEAFQNASQFADGIRSIKSKNQNCGDPDPYINELDDKAVRELSLLVMLSYPYMPDKDDKQPSPAYIKELLHNFQKITPYREKFAQIYMENNDHVDEMKKFQLQKLLNSIDNDYLGKDSEKLFTDLSGLCILFDTFF